MSINAIISFLKVHHDHVGLCVRLVVVLDDLLHKDKVAGDVASLDEALLFCSNDLG